MNRINLRFEGHRDYVKTRELRPVGREGRPVEVLQFQDTWSFGEQRSSCQEVLFPDGTCSFFRPKKNDKCTLFGIPYSDLHLHDRGAYTLVSQLGMDGLCAETSIAEIEGVLGSLQEGVPGEVLSKTPNNQINEALESQDNLAELYIYTVVAFDPDKDSKNLALNKKEGRIKLIDNECSGAPYSYTEPYTRANYLVLPYQIEDQLQGGSTPISEKYRSKLQHFIDNQETFTEELLPFYSPEAVQGMFERAALLLDVGRLLPLDEMKALIQKRLVFNNAKVDERSESPFNPFQNPNFNAGMGYQEDLSSEPSLDDMFI